MAVLIWSTLMQTTSGGAFCRPQFQAKNKSKEITISSSKGFFLFCWCRADSSRCGSCWRKTHLIPFFFLLSLFVYGFVHDDKTTVTQQFSMIWSERKLCSSPPPTGHVFRCVHHPKDCGGTFQMGLKVFSNDLFSADLLNTGWLNSFRISLLGGQRLSLEVSC